MTRADLRELVRKRLGAPVIKVELDDCQIDDWILYTRNEYIKWAIGTATKETYFTVLLKGGQYRYDMPEGCTNIVEWSDKGIGDMGGINTLFTVENFLYNQGMFNPKMLSGGAGGILNYHMALDFLEVLGRYTPSNYRWQYHTITNQLEVMPAPPSGSYNTVETSAGDEIVIDSPGYVLVKAFMLEGSTVGVAPSGTDLWVYDKPWVQDFVTANCKVTLGMIRRKFANFASIGNAGISLDGDSLVSEGQQEIESLRERLKMDEESEHGFGIFWG